MNSNLPILVADDDNEDTQLLLYAFKQAEIKNPVTLISDGAKVIEYLTSVETTGGVMPGLVFLDLNMPKLSGVEVLKMMKEHPEWQKIPVLVFSTSNFKDDIKQVYSLGAASYIIKPLNFAKLVSIIKAIKAYWIESVTLF